MKLNTIIKICILFMICLLAGCSYGNGKLEIGSDSTSESDANGDSAGDHYVLVIWPDGTQEKVKRPYKDDESRKQFISKCGAVLILEFDEKGNTIIKCDPSMISRIIKNHDEKDFQSIICGQLWGIANAYLGDDDKDQEEEDPDEEIVDDDSNQEEDPDEEIVDGDSNQEENVQQDSTEAKGSLDKRIIQKVVHQHLGEIRACYEKELSHTKGLAGRIGVTWIVSPEGEVTNAFVKESTMNNKNVETCITGSIKTWRFPKPKGGGTVQIEYPFVFEPYKTDK